MNIRIRSIVAALLLVLVLPCAAWAAQPVHIKIVLNAQNGTGGTSELYVEPGAPMPQITPPERRGYYFQGYFDGASGRGNQYYDSVGEPLRTCEFTDTAALYAFWKVKTYGITYDNMEGAEYGVLSPRVHTYGKNTEISDPTREGYTFFGWQINKSLIASLSLTLGASAYEEEIVLAAVWNKATLVTQQNNTTETVVIHTEDLNQIFQRQVENPTVGVTADDLNSEEVRLTMIASNEDGMAEGAADIVHLAQGEVLGFYDFMVTKTVNKVDREPITTVLNELPNTIQVEITLGEQLKNRASYRVYRFHNGQAEALPLGPVTDSTKQKEFFEFSDDGTTLVLHTRRLSTYAVVGGQREIGGTGSIEQGSAGLDIQAQVKEGGDGPVYKIDIVWGPMRFNYSTGREWDPDAHRYTNVRIYDWIPSECYQNGNNKITIYNHSNADVLVGFEVFPHMKQGELVQLMDGVDMTVSSENKEHAQPATNIILERVPAEYRPAPFISGYLRLNGSPTDPEFYKGLVMDEDGYVQIADIAVTIAHLDGPRTPKTK